jgi:hypothetical protein
MILSCLRIRSFSPEGKINPLLRLHQTTTHLSQSLNFPLQSLLHRTARRVELRDLFAPRLKRRAVPDRASGTTDRVSKSPLLRHGLRPDIEKREVVVLNIPGRLTKIFLDQREDLFSCHILRSGQDVVGFVVLLRLLGCQKARCDTPTSHAS